MAKLLHAERRRVNCQSINMQFFLVFFSFLSFTVSLTENLLNNECHTFQYHRIYVRLTDFFPSLSKNNLIVLLSSFTSTASSAYCLHENYIVNRLNNFFINFLVLHSDVGKNHTFFMTYKCISR